MGRLFRFELGADSRPIDRPYYKPGLQLLPRVGVAPLKMSIQSVEAIARAVAGIRDGYARVARIKRNELDHGYGALKKFGISESRRRLNIVEHQQPVRH